MQGQRMQIEPGRDVEQLAFFIDAKRAFHVLDAGGAKTQLPGKEMMAGAKFEGAVVVHTDFRGRGTDALAVAQHSPTYQRRTDLVRPADLIRRRSNGDPH